MPKYLQNIQALFVDQPLASVTLIFAFVVIFSMHKMYQRQLDDRQKELDRLAEDNREYRKTFRSLLSKLPK